MLARPTSSHQAHDKCGRAQRRQIHPNHVVGIRTVLLPTLGLGKVHVTGAIGRNRVEFPPPPF